MLYNEDKYYLLGYSERMDKVITLRVDRMSVPEMLPEPIHPEPEGFSPADYATNTFSMYEGEQGVVKLLCENQLMDSMIDRFGLAFETAVADEEHFIAEVEVSVSQTFFAWVFQFAGGIKILGPEPILKEYHDMLNHAQ
jgi:predicted DNA-binding transcriptional regulator YafY